MANGLRARTSRFDTTRWSLVQAAGAEVSSEARAALATLCERYWTPLYWFARRQGHGADDAQDVTQAFLTRFIDKHDVRAARRERGRFRSFLLASFKHFILNDIQSRRAVKRGGSRTPLSLEFETAERTYVREPPDTRTPETIFDRRWALTVLDRVVQRLRREAMESGKREEFDRLKPSLLGESAPGGYEAWGRELGLSEGAVRVAVHRLRRRYQRALRDEIAQTVSTSDEVEEEIRYLLGALGR